MDRLKFGEQESIDAVALYEKLLLRLPKYGLTDDNPRKRRKQPDHKPLAKVQCCWCENMVTHPEMYFSFTHDSAHVDCVDKMRAKKAELDPIMEVRA